MTLKCFFLLRINDGLNRHQKHSSFHYVFASLALHSCRESSSMSRIRMRQQTMIDFVLMKKVNVFFSNLSNSCSCVCFRVWMSLATDSLVMHQSGRDFREQTQALLRFFKRNIFSLGIHFRERRQPIWKDLHSFFQMFRHRQTLREYYQEESQRRRKKTNQQCERRRKRKKTTLLSSFAKSPDGPEHFHALSDQDDLSPDEILELSSKNDPFPDLQPPMNLFQPTEDNDAHDFDEFAASDGHPSSDISTCSSPSNSQDDSSDVMSEDLPVEDDRDNRLLYPSSLSHVEQFSNDIIEFARSARLPENQRNQLLDLFKKYLPSPNLVPASSSNLLSTYRNDVTFFLGSRSFFRVDRKELVKRAKPELHSSMRQCLLSIIVPLFVFSDMR